jgi:hypothetical protein
MQEFDVQETDKFKSQLEEAVLWLYSFNIEQSEEFADKKYFELQSEINTLKANLKRNPRMGQLDVVSGLRRFPVYDGRFVMTWLLLEAQKSVLILEFNDSKYPKQLRQFHMSEEDN